MKSYNDEHGTRIIEIESLQDFDDNLLNGGRFLDVVDDLINKSGEINNVKFIRCTDCNRQITNTQAIEVWNLNLCEDCFEKLEKFVDNVVNNGDY